MLTHKLESSKIKIIQQQIDAIESEKSELIKKFPLLVKLLSDRTVIHLSIHLGRSEASQQDF